MVLEGSSSQEYPVNAGDTQGSILGIAHFLLYINDHPGELSVILLSILMILLSTLSVIRHMSCGNNYSWLLNLNLIYEALWTGVRSGLLILMLGKLRWFLLTGLIKLVLLMWKWMGLFLRQNHILRCRGWLSLQSWIRTFTLSLLLKLPPRKLEPWIVLWTFYFLRLLRTSINLVYGLA